MSDANKIDTANDHIHRLSNDLKHANKQAEKYKAQAEQAGFRVAELTRQLQEAREDKQRAEQVAGRICARAVPELSGGFQLRFARDHVAGLNTYPQGATVGVLLPSMDLPLDFIADGLRNGLIRATPIVPLSVPAADEGQGEAAGDAE